MLPEENLGFCCSFSVSALTTGRNETSGLHEASGPPRIRVHRGEARLQSHQRDVCPARLQLQAPEAPQELGRAGESRGAGELSWSDTSSRLPRTLRRHHPSRRSRRSEVSTGRNGATPAVNSLVSSLEPFYPFWGHIEGPHMCTGRVHPWLSSSM